MANPTNLTVNKTTFEQGENIVLTLVNPDPAVYHTMDYHEYNSLGDSGSSDEPIRHPDATDFTLPPNRPIPAGKTITISTTGSWLKIASYRTYTLKTWSTVTGGSGNWTTSGLIGERSVTVIVYPAGTAPSVSSLGLSEGTAAVVSAAIGAYVQGVSTLNWNLASVAPPGTKIVAGSLEIDGVIYPAVSGRTPVLAKSGTFTVKGSVTNNLGQTVTRTETITVLPYQAPKVTNLVAYRATSAGVEDDNGTYVRLSFAASASALTVGSQKNRTTWTLRTRPRGGSTWTTRASGSNSTTLNPTSTTTPSGYPLGTAYEVRVDIADKFGATAAVTYVSKGGVLLDWGEGSMGIGKMWERGTLDVFGDAYFGGKVDAASGVFAGDVSAFGDIYSGGSKVALVGAGPVLLDAENLNTVTTPGLYLQQFSASVTTAMNYPPTGRAGWLEVLYYNGGNDYIIHRWTDYQAQTEWMRAKYGTAAFSPWRIVGGGNSGSLTLNTGSGSILWSLSGGVMTVYVDITGSFGANDTQLSSVALPDYLRPSGSAIITGPTWLDPGGSGILYVSGSGGLIRHGRGVANTTRIRGSVTYSVNI